jgi:hypothetical protein
MPPLLEPEYHGKPGASSLLYEADLVAPKPTTDVLLNASAYAPRGRPARTVPVSMRVGPIHKQLLVHGSRVYTRGIAGVAPSAPVEFRRRQLTYEWAFGGTDTRDPDPKNHVMDARNPVGKGFALRERHLVDQPAHSIEYLDGRPEKAGPAGFGPIASYWSPRLELAGTYDERWKKDRRPLLPADYDARHVLCAPADQRPKTHLRGGEPVELVHLTESGVLRFQLPTVALSFTSHFGRRRETHPGTLSTVIGSPDEGRLILVWQSALEVPSTQLESLDTTVIEEKASA